MLFVKFIVLLLLGFVVVSLFSGLFFLVKDKGQTDRTANALTVRIGLSIVVIIIVMIAGATGLIEVNPNPTLDPGAAPDAASNVGDAGGDGDTGTGRRRE